MDSYWIYKNINYPAVKGEVQVMHAYTDNYGALHWLDCDIWYSNGGLSTSSLDLHLLYQLCQPREDGSDEYSTDRPSETNGAPLYGLGPIWIHNRCRDGKILVFKSFFKGFWGFIGFFVQRPNTTVRPKGTWERKTSHTWYALRLLTDYNIQNYKHQASL